MKDSNLFDEYGRPSPSGEPLDAGEIMKHRAAYIGYFAKGLFYPVRAAISLQESFLKMNKKPLEDFYEIFEKTANNPEKLGAYLSGYRLSEFMLNALVCTLNIPPMSLKAAYKSTDRGLRDAVRKFNPDMIGYIAQNKWTNDEVFMPKIMVPTIQALDIKGMKDAGIDAILLDVEDTINPTGKAFAHPELIPKLSEMLKIYGGDKILLVSNFAGVEKIDKGMMYADGIEKSIERQMAGKGFSLENGILKVLRHKNKKPGPIPEAFEATGVPPERTAYIGNLSYLDNAFANRFGMVPIQVVYFLPERIDRGNEYNMKASTATRKDAENILYLAKGGIRGPISAPDHPLDGNLSLVTDENILQHLDLLKPYSGKIQAKVANLLTLDIAPKYLPTMFFDPVYVKGKSYDHTKNVPMELKGEFGYFQKKSQKKENKKEAKA